MAKGATIHYSPVTIHGYPMPTTLLKLSCPDRVGLLSRISGFVAEHGGNLVEVHQFTDAEAKWFFTRMAIETGALRVGLGEFRERFLTRAVFKTSSNGLLPLAKHTGPPAAATISDR